MCSVSVLCPLCAQSSFASIDALRVSLIRAANGPLSCPICHELFLGLDKLTIHLFSHTDLFAIASQTPITSSNSVTAVSDEKSQNLVGSPIVRRTSTLQSEAIQSKEPQELVTVQQRAQQKQKEECSADDTKGVVSEVIAKVKKETWQNLPTCDICEFNFRNQELLDLHFRLVHQNDPSSATEINQPSNTQSLHSSTAQKKVHEFKCHLCAKTFKMKGSLRVHLKVVHLVGLPSSNSASKPNICDRIRTQKDDTVNSQNTSTSALQINAPKLGPLLIEDPTQMPANLKLQRQLTSTDITIATNSCRDMSMNPRQEMLSTAVGATRSSDSTEQPDLEATLDKDNPSKTSTENAKIWECDVCSKSFTTKYFLKKHKRLHTGEMPYTCEICARTFTFQQSYHKHLLYHSDEKPHVCVTCGRAFKELSTLHNHERIHSGEKPFKCDVCDKSFRQRVSFLVHTRIHTGVMPYKCEVCQKSFRYKVSQRTHKCLPNNLLPDVNVPTKSNTLETSEQISECFIKAFLESTTANALQESQNSPHSAEIAGINAMDINDGPLDVKHVMDEAMLSKTIDDIVVESCNKLGIGCVDSVLSLPTTSNGLCSSIVYGTDGHNSPSLKFQNMRLYSPVMLQPQVQSLTNAVKDETTDFPHFLLEDERNDVM